MSGLFCGHLLQPASLSFHFPRSLFFSLCPHPGVLLSRPREASPNADWPRTGTSLITPGALSSSDSCFRVWQNHVLLSNQSSLLITLCSRFAPLTPTHFPVFCDLSPSLPSSCSPRLNFSPAPGRHLSFIIFLLP